MSEPITPHDLAKFFPGATKSVLARNADLPAGDNRGQLPVVQKPKAHGSHTGQHQEADAATGKPHRVRFEFLVSNAIKRDGFGMSETVADCLIRAVRRFINGDT